MASRPMATSASPPPWAAAVSPSKKLRLIPAEEDYALARIFKGLLGTTVSVL